MVEALVNWPMGVEPVPATITFILHIIPFVHFENQLERWYNRLSSEEKRHKSTKKPLKRSEKGRVIMCVSQNDQKFPIVSSSSVEVVVDQ